jgi:hypothetical protein
LNYYHLAHNVFSNQEKHLPDAHQAGVSNIIEGRIKAPQSAPFRGKSALLSPEINP